MTGDGLDGRVRNLLPRRVGFRLGSTGLEVKSLYVTDALAAVCIDEVDLSATGVELIAIGDAESDASDEALVRLILGNLMRTVYDLLGQFGVNVPCFCMVRARKPTGFGELLTQLQVDQDWARGDFAVATVTDFTDGDTPALLSDLKYEDFDVSLGPIARDTIVRRFDEKAKGRQLASEHEQLLEAIRRCLSGEDTPENALKRWLKERKGEIMNVKSP